MLNEYFRNLSNFQSSILLSPFPLRTAGGENGGGSGGGDGSGSGGVLQPILYLKDTWAL